MHTIQLEVSWHRILDKYALPRYMGHPDLPGKMASPEDPGKSGSDCTTVTMVTYTDTHYLLIVITEILVEAECVFITLPILKMPDNLECQKGFPFRFLSPGQNFKGVKVCRVLKLMGNISVEIVNISEGEQLGMVY